MTASLRIDALRISCGLTAAEENLVRRSAERLAPEIEGWVERFYLRILTDPVAAEILGDEGRVIRLRRSLTAWLHEVFTLPLDATYERTRREIGRTHQRLGMPEYLMVTAMGALRRDISQSIERIWGEGDLEGWRVRGAVGKMLDLELALMLDAYGRRGREIRLRRDRALHAERTARRFARTTRDAVDAVLCWVDLLEKQPQGPREVWAGRLRDALRLFAIPPLLAEKGDAPPRRSVVRVADLFARALENVSVSSLTAVEVVVDPPHLVAHLHVEPLQVALEELLQNAVEQVPGGTARMTGRAWHSGLLVEVTDEGAGWPPGVRSVDDLLALREGTGLSFCEYVAELHGGSIELYAAEGQGAGVRLKLPGSAAIEGGTEDAALAADPRRDAP